MYKIAHIIESLENGQLKQAKEQIQWKCKTKPEKQAFKVGQVVGALMDEDDYNNPDLARRFLCLFDN